MIDGKELSEQVRIYQVEGVWTTRMHFLANELINVVICQLCLSENEAEDFYQSAYLLLLSVARIADADRDLFNYFYTCLVNMWRSSFARTQLLRKIQEEIWHERRNYNDLA